MGDDITIQGSSLKQFKGPPMVLALPAGIGVNEGPIKVMIRECTKEDLKIIPAKFTLGEQYTPIFVIKGHDFDSNGEKMIICSQFDVETIYLGGGADLRYGDWMAIAGWLSVYHKDSMAFSTIKYWFMGYSSLFKVPGFVGPEMETAVEFFRRAFAKGPQPDWWLMQNVSELAAYKETDAY